MIWLGRSCYGLSQFVSKVVNFFGQAMGPRYDGKYLRSVVNEQLGDVTLKQTLAYVVIPAFDIKLLQPVIFTTNDVWTLNPSFFVFIPLKCF